jgi:acetone carboxylase gamma subunit
MTLLAPFANGDLYLSVMKGGGGLGDPLLRPLEAVERDIREGHLLPRFAESVYGVSGRDGFRRRRLERAVPVREWVAGERERVLAQRLSRPIKEMLAESMRLSPRWAAEYRGFWDLPADFDFDVQTPTVTLARAEPGRIEPGESADEFLERSNPHGAHEGVPAATGGKLDEETLQALFEERLTRREVKEIQSGYKDADRFEKWLSVLQRSVSYEDPIVLPAGEGLNIVRRRGDGELVYRCDCGADFCRHNRNWKMDAVVHVRQSESEILEIYPRMAGPDPDLQQVREYYCPVCARQLEVEALPPGYPVVHDFLPDIRGFYRGWLGRELPV